MAAFKSLLITAKVETAKKARKCQHNKTKHRIAAGEICLAVQDSYGGMRSYCAACATEMLRLAVAELNGHVRAIEKKPLHNDSPPVVAPAL